MASPDGPAGARPDADGVRVERRPGRAWDVWVLAALAIVVVGWLLVGRDDGAQRVATEPDTREPSALASAAGGDEAPVGTSRGASDADAGPDAGADTGDAVRAPGDDPSAGPPFAAPGATLPSSPHRQRVLARRLARRLPRTTGPDGKPEIAAADAIAALQAAGVRDGIAAFPPPGTDPPKSGVIVPEGFVLSEGFIRHHQATDEGEPLPPILMVHPDYELIGPDGEPVPLGPDRVVPPELAPEGLEIEMLEVPARGAGRTP